MQKLDQKLLLSKFRGCLLGVLVGDCAGAPFEHDEITSGDKLVLKKNLDKLEGPPFKAPLKPYTDDTAMTRSLARTLVTCGPSQREIAKGFTREFFDQPQRGYGQSIVTVFKKLRATKCAEPVIGPAKEQFLGAGSYGNGGAMRVSPLALYCVNNVEVLAPLVRETTMITHTNALGINGALLQAQAVHQALLIDPAKGFDMDDIRRYVAGLMAVMEKAEVAEEDDVVAVPKDYQNQLQEMLRLLNKNEEPHEEEVVNTLGHSVSALFSVPTAIYSFLRNQKPAVQAASAYHPFRATLEYAISLGGDTDTIASMACAIAGAYYGDAVINTNLLKHCEASDEMAELAEQLFRQVVK